MDVIFGKPDNFRREKIDFEVLDWLSQYHAILGQPAYVRFMAVPHYAYIKLKIPRPKGTITINGSFTRSDNCDRDFSKISKMFGTREELTQLKEPKGPDLLPVMNKKATWFTLQTFSISSIRLFIHLCTCYPCYSIKAKCSSTTSRYITYPHTPDTRGYATQSLHIIDLMCKGPSS